MSKSNPNNSAKKQSLSPPDKGTLNGRAHKAFLKAITYVLNKEYNDPNSENESSQLWQAWKQQGVETATYSKLCLIVGQEPNVKISQHEITDIILTFFPILSRHYIFKKCPNGSVEFYERTTAPPQVLLTQQTLRQSIEKLETTTSPQSGDSPQSLQLKTILNIPPNPNPSILSPTAPPFTPPTSPPSAKKPNSIPPLQDSPLPSSLNQHSNIETTEQTTTPSPPKSIIEISTDVSNTTSPWIEEIQSSKETTPESQYNDEDEWTKVTTPKYKLQKHKQKSPTHH